MILISTTSLFFFFIQQLIKKVTLSTTNAKAQLVLVFHVNLLLDFVRSVNEYINVVNISLKNGTTAHETKSSIHPARVGIAATSITNIL